MFSTKLFLDSSRIQSNILSLATDYLQVSDSKIMLFLKSSKSKKSIRASTIIISIESKELLKWLVV